MRGETLIYILEVGAVIFVIWLVWRFVQAVMRFRGGSPREPIDDDSLGVRAPRKRGPHGRAGAVALAQPDDDDDEMPAPRRL